VEITTGLRRVNRTRKESVIKFGVAALTLLHEAIRGHAGRAQAGEHEERSDPATSLKDKLNEARDSSSDSMKLSHLAWSFCFSLLKHAGIGGMMDNKVGLS